MTSTNRKAAGGGVEASHSQTGNRGGVNRQRVRLAFICLAIALAASCSRRLRIGEHVWVLNDGVPVRAFIVERTGEARVRVQFEGCDSTWQKEITTDRITGRVSDAEAIRPPARLACAPASPSRKGDSAVGVAAPVKIGDRVRVRWRGSTYNAGVTGILAPDKILVHYEGLENAWDEVVPIDRIDGVR